MSTIVCFTILLAGILIAITIVDVREMRIPDYLNVLLGASGSSFWLVQNADILPRQLAGGFGVAAFLWLVRCIHFKITGRIGLGLGDVKMVGACAIWISPFSYPLLLLVASVSGLVFALYKGSNKYEQRIAFGPFLAVGLMSSWLTENVS